MPHSLSSYGHAPQQAEHSILPCLLKIRSVVHLICCGCNVDSCQLSFQSLETEENGDCSSDYVAVHRDVEGQEEIGPCPWSLGSPACLWTQSSWGNCSWEQKGSGSGFLHSPAFPPSLPPTTPSPRSGAGRTRGRTKELFRQKVWKVPSDLRVRRESAIEISPLAQTSSLRGLPRRSLSILNRDTHQKSLLLNNCLKDYFFFYPMPCLFAGPLTASCLGSALTSKVLWFRCSCPCAELF